MRIVNWIGCSTIKSYITPLCYCSCVIDGGNTAATSESLMSNSGNGIGDGDGGEAAATNESPEANRCNAIGYNEIGYRSAVDT